MNEEIVMPSRTRSLKSRTAVLDHDREPEALGLGIAPELPGEDRSELVERAEIGAGQLRRGAPHAQGVGHVAHLLDVHSDRSIPSDRDHAQFPRVGQVELQRRKTRPQTRLAMDACS
jgi:hypothetical protein